MNYLPDNNFYFVHIPKNGGQSMRNAMARAGRPSAVPLANDLGIREEDAQSAMEAGFQHPELGRIHPAHLPLWLLQEHFPQSWAALTAAKSVALAREPRDRFISALMQRLKEFRGAGPIRADDPLVADEARRVCDWLDARNRFADLEYIHFVRQSDFTDLDGVRTVDAVFPVSASSAAEEWIAANTGLTLEIGHDHSRRQPKHWGKVVQPVARFVGRKMMPHSVKRALHPFWMKSGVFTDAADSYQTIDLGADIDAFICEYYADDRFLHEEAQVFVASDAGAAKAS